MFGGKKWKTVLSTNNDSGAKTLFPDIDIFQNFFFFHFLGFERNNVGLVYLILSGICIIYLLLK